MRSYYSKDVRKYNEMSYEGKYLLDPKYMTKRDIQHYYRYYNMTKNGGQLKKIIVLIFCICFFSYIFLDYNLKTKLTRLRDRFDFVARIEADYNVTQAYFVNTLGCRMPYFDVTNDNIIQFMYKPRNNSCRKALTRTSDVGAVLYLNLNEMELLERYNISDVSSLKCAYTEILRRNDKQNIYKPPIKFTLTPHEPVTIKPGIEFIRVRCNDSESKKIYEDYHFFVINKTKTKLEPESNLTLTVVTTAETVTAFERVSFAKTLPKKKGPIATHMPPKKSKHTDSSTAAQKERLSVMILGIDSVSHLNFLRQMPHSADYIHRKLEHVEFWGYNKVGDNTYPNLVPALSGLDELELNLACLTATTHASNFDNCPFIWKRYSEAGFNTVYAEDVANLGLFNFLRPGFMEQPTDYYLRPIMLEMEKYISYLQFVNVQLCKGGRRTADVVLELIRKLIPYLQTQDFFSFFWTVSLTHDMLNMPKLLDDDIVNLFDKFSNAGIFNKTVVFLMSDHGLRWGSFRKTYQGMMEERQPLLIALYPAWMKQKYATAIKNLELNAKRLTTHFDLHATMLDLLNLHNLQDEDLAKRATELSEAETLPRSISLFLPVPEERTCENAAIASHWCTCHQRHELQTNDQRVQRAARYIVKLINKRLKEHPQCRVLYLNSILEAIIAAPHRHIVKNVTDDYSIDITVRIQTKPGLGLFESTVRMSSYPTTLTGTISRLNLYGSQSYCINDYALKMFCYCHR